MSFNWTLVVAYWATSIVLIAFIFALMKGYDRLAKRVDRLELLARTDVNNAVIDLVTRKPELVVSNLAANAPPLVVVGSHRSNDRHNDAPAVFGRVYKHKGNDEIDTEETPVVIDPTEKRPLLARLWFGKDTGEDEPAFKE